MSEPDDTAPNDATGMNRRRLLQTVGVAAAGLVGVSGTASAHQSKFFGCERVCTGTQGSYAVVAVDDTYQCREMQQASGSVDVPWDWTTYCYDAADDEVVVGLLEENVIQGGTENPDATCALCLNENDCAAAAYDSPSAVVTALNENDTCGVCTGNVEVSSSCTTTTAPGDGGADDGGSGDGSDGTDGEDGSSGDDTDGGSGDGSGGSDGSSGDESSGDGSGDGGSGDDGSGDGGSGDDSSGGDESNGDDSSGSGGTDGSGDDGSENESSAGDDSSDSDDSGESGDTGDGNEDGGSGDSDDDQSETTPSDEQGGDDRSVDPNGGTDTGRSRNDRPENDFDIDDDYRESRDPSKEYPDVDLEELAEYRADQESDDGPPWECEHSSENRTAMERWYDRDDTPADPRDRDSCGTDTDETEGTMTAMERWFARRDPLSVSDLFESNR